MAVRSQRSLRERLGVDSRGTPVFLVPGFSSRVGITRQFMEARRRSGQPAISSTPQFEHTFARTSAGWQFDATGRVVGVPSNRERWSDHFGPRRTMLLTEGARTNYLLNSGAPATQTTESLGTGTYTLWVRGTGTAAVAGATATITGAGTANQATPVVFTVTVAGTVTVTVAGSLTFFQLENSGVVSAPMTTGAATFSRTPDRLIWTPTVRGSGLFGTSGTIVCVFMLPNVGFGQQALFSIDDGDDNERITLINPSAGTTTLKLRAVNGGVQTIEVDAGVTLSTNNFFKAAVAWSPAGIAVACNGNAVVSGAGTMPSTQLTRLMYGATNGATNLNGWIGILARYNSRLSDAMLRDASRNP